MMNGVRMEPSFQLSGVRVEPQMAFSMKVMGLKVKDSNLMSGTCTTRNNGTNDHARQVRVMQRKLTRDVKKYASDLFEARHFADYVQMSAFSLSQKIVGQATADNAPKSDWVVFAEVAAESFILAESLKLVRNGLFLMFRSKFDVPEAEARKKAGQSEALLSILFMTVRHFVTTHA